MAAVHHQPDRGRVDADVDALQLARLVAAALVAVEGEVPEALGRGGRAAVGRLLRAGGRDVNLDLGGDLRCVGTCMYVCRIGLRIVSKQS